MLDMILGKDAEERSLKEINNIFASRGTNVKSQSWEDNTASIDSYVCQDAATLQRKEEAVILSCTNCWSFALFGLLQSDLYFS